MARGPGQLRPRAGPRCAHPARRSRATAASPQSRSTASDATRTSLAHGSTMTGSASSRGTHRESTACSSRSWSAPRTDGELRARRRRAPPARRRLAGLTQIPAVVRDVDGGTTRAGARREPPARRPEPDRGSHRLPRADRAVRADPRRGRPPGGQEPRRRSATRCDCSISRRRRAQAIAEGRISEGHGRALAALTIPELQRAVLSVVLERQLSVRQTEELVRRKRGRRQPGAPARGALARPGRPRGPAARHAGHQGRHQPHAPRRPARHRLLFRRGAGSHLRDHHARRGGAAPRLRSSTDRRRERDHARWPPRMSADRARRARRTKGSEYTAANIQVLEGLEAVRKRPGHVHRLHRRARPAPARLGGRRQQHRRGDGQRRHAHRRHDPRRRQRSRSSTTAAASRSASTRPARTRSRWCTPCSTPAASSAVAATRSPAACTASASAW